MLLFSLLIFYGFFAVIWIHEKLEIFSESPGHQSCSCLQLRSAVYGCSIRTSEKPIQIRRYQLCIKYEGIDRRR